MSALAGLLKCVQESRALKQSYCFMVSVLMEWGGTLGLWGSSRQLIIGNFLGCPPVVRICLNPDVCLLSFLFFLKIKLIKWFNEPVV